MKDIAHTNAYITAHIAPTRTTATGVFCWVMPWQRGHGFQGSVSKTRWKQRDEWVAAVPGVMCYGVSSMCNAACVVCDAYELVPIGHS